MRIIKKLGIGLGVLIALLLIIALFVSKDYAVERHIVINKPRAEVFAYLKKVKNQANYSTWSRMDPHMKTSYRGTDGTVGFVSAWESTNDNLGVGEQEIVKITEGVRVDMKLRFKEPFEAENDAYFITTDAGTQQTQVTWGIKGAFAYPMNLMGLLMDMDQQIGKDFDTGLANLKAILEK